MQKILKLRWDDTLGFNNLGDLVRDGWKVSQMISSHPSMVKLDTGDCGYTTRIEHGFIVFVLDHA